MAPRAKWSALLLLVILALTAGFYRWPISSALVAQETGVRLSQSLGLELRRPGRAQFNLLPVPTLHMVDVEVRGRNNATILTAPAASARLALFPLLSGRFELAAATLVQPTIFLIWIRILSRRAARYRRPSRPGPPIRIQRRLARSKSMAVCCASSAPPTISTRWSKMSRARSTGRGSTTRSTSICARAGATSRSQSKPALESRPRC